MANRSYLYSLSNRPSSYADRPETISGLSEWAYTVPFSYRVLLSGDPQLCASLISDGFENEPAGQKSGPYAVSGEFETGFARLRKFCALVRGATGSAELRAQLDNTEAFLDRRRDRFLLLETVELDTMTEDTPDGLLAAVEREVDVCRQVGAAIDALPADDPTTAAAALTNIGLTLGDDFDNVPFGEGSPLGVSWWTDILYFSLWNRAEFAADQ